jgi:3-oxoacyl-[acyl-carrier protein] reductase
MSYVSINGKTALITGASRGIGKTITRMLAREGVRVALNGRSVEHLEAVRMEIEAMGAEAVLCPGDLADPAVPERIVKETLRQLGGLDILINNAGVGIPKPLMDTTAQEWDYHMAINARAPFLLCREAVPHLRKSHCATIINISSVVGTKGYVNQGAYSASKHALMGLTKVLAQEVFKDDIRVYVLSPGGVATEMVTQMRPDIDPDDLIDPEEFAEIIRFLLTHRGSAVIDEIKVRRASNSPWK